MMNTFIKSTLIVLASVICLKPSFADSLNVRSIGACDTRGDAYGVAVVDSYACIADGDSGLSIINVSDPANPVFTGRCMIPGKSFNLCIKNGFAYVVADTSGLYIVDISNAAAPFVTGFINTPGNARTVCIVDTLAYIADSKRGVQVVNINNPSSPTIVGHFMPHLGSEPYSDSVVTDVRVVGNTAYVAHAYVNIYTPLGWWMPMLVTVDISDIAHPTVLGACYIPAGMTLPACLQTDGNFIHIGTNWTIGPVWYYHIFDVTNPLMPTSIADLSYEAGNVYCHNMVVTQDYTFMALGNGGIRVARISDRYHPFEAGYYDGPEYMQGVAISGDLIYTARGVDGLGIYQFLRDTIPPVVTLQSPNGGEQWMGGTSQQIRWTQSDNLKIMVDSLFYSTNNGVSWTAISRVQPPDTLYSWLIPMDYSVNCRVKVVANDYGLNADSSISSGPFTICPDTIRPTVQMVAPNGGEEFYYGGQYTVSWSQSDNGAVVSDTVSYSINNGGNWTIIYSGSACTSYNWKIPNRRSDSCLVKVVAVDRNNNTAFDYSDGLFSMLADTVHPQVTVTSPNGGECWQIGDQHLVTWMQSDSTGIMADSVLYSADDGANWSLVYGGGAVTSYNWTIPNVISNNCRVKVIAVDSAMNATQDISNAVFTIPPDSANIRTISTIKLPGQVYRIAIRDSTAFVAGDTGISILNIADVYHPRIINTISINTGSQDLCFLGKFLCIVAANDYFKNLAVYNIDDPVHPVAIDSLSEGIQLEALSVYGDNIYLTSSYYGVLRVVNASNPSNLLPVGWWGSGSGFRDICSVWSYTYLTSGATGELYTIYTILPAYPTQVCKWGSTGCALNGIIVSDAKAYIAVSSAIYGHLYIFSLSDPSFPLLLKIYGRVGAGNDVSFQDHAIAKYVYLSDGIWGLRVIDVTNTSNPQESAYYHTPGIARSAVFAGKYVFVAEDTMGVRILQLTRDTLPPTAPTLISPTANGCYNGPLLNLSWHPCTDALSGISRYTIQYSVSPAFANATTVDRVDTTIALTLADSTYYWRVRAMDGFGNESQWSETRRFTIDTQNPDAPGLIAPQSNMWFGDQQMIFKWGTVQKLSKSLGKSSPVNYVLRVGLDSSFTSIVAAETTLATCDTLVLGEARYYWQVGAFYNAGNAGSYSQYFTFGVDLTPPVIGYVDSTENLNAGDQGPYTIKAVVTDVDTVSSVYLYYSINDSIWDSIAMQQTGDTMIAAIPHYEVGYNQQRKVQYFIKALDRFGHSAHSRIYSFVIAGLPDVFAFQGCFPNPARESVTFKFQLPQAADVAIDIYNVMGQIVDHYIWNDQPAGFRLKSIRMTKYSQGIYIYRFMTGNKNITGKMVIIK